MWKPETWVQFFVFWLGLHCIFYPRSETMFNIFHNCLRLKSWFCFHSSTILIFLKMPISIGVLCNVICCLCRKSCNLGHIGVGRHAYKNQTMCSHCQLYEWKLPDRDLFLVLFQSSFSFQVALICLSKLHPKCKIVSGTWVSKLEFLVFELGAIEQRLCKHLKELNIFCHTSVPSTFHNNCLFLQF